MSGQHTGRKAGCICNPYHVLSETLSQAGSVSLLNEVPQGKGVVVGVSASESLVGHVEEGVVTSLLDGVTDRLPFLLSRVHSSGIVSACMQ
jgi:hypothetical protein